MSQHFGGARLLGAGIGIGFVAGLVAASALGGVTVLVANQGTATLVGLIGIAALLAMVAGGWVALILHYRSHRHWRALGAVAALLDGTVLGVGLMAPVSIVATWTAGLGLLGIEVVAASVVPAPEGPRRGPWWHVATTIVWPPAVLSGMYVVLVALNSAAVRAH